MRRALVHRVYAYGPVTDIVYSGGRLARCECVHGKVWTEGDYFEPQGKACEPCARDSLRQWEAVTDAAPLPAKCPGCGGDMLPYDDEGTYTSRCEDCGRVR